MHIKLNLSVICFLLFLLFPAPSMGQDTVSLARARELTDSGSYEAAGVMYLEVKALQDSIFYSNYDSTIEDIYDANQVDEQKSEYTRTVSSFLFYIFILALVILAIVIVSNRILKRNTASLIKSEEELEQAKHIAEVSVTNKSTAISNMSHEIKTPLNSIVGFSQLLAEGDIDDQMIKQCTDIINLNSELLLKLINDVLDISSLDINNMKISLSKHDAVLMCTEVAETFKNLQNTHARISFVCDLKKAEIETDSSRFQQVMFNLMSNAVKFCKEGEITISLSKKEKKFIQISVTDTGCGIPISKQQSVFNRFERISELAPGAGIGLSLCQLIIKRLGGDIWIDSSYTEGARFTFIHPITQEVIR